MITADDVIVSIIATARVIRAHLDDLATWASVFEPMPGNLLRMWQAWMINRSLGIE